MTPRDRKELILIILAALIYLVLCYWIFYSVGPEFKPSIVSEAVKKAMKRHGIQDAFEDDRGTYFVRRGKRCNL